MYTAAAYELGLERLRKYLFQMSDGELLRFGQVAKYTSGNDTAVEGRESSLVRLREAPGGMEQAKAGVALAWFVLDTICRYRRLRALAISIETAEVTVLQDKFILT